MKKVLLGLVTLTVICSCIFAFVACGPAPDDGTGVPDSTGYGEAAPNAKIVGSNIISTKGVEKNGKKMFLNAVSNFQTSNYSAAWLVGQVDTTVLGGIKISQMVDALRVRQDGNQYMYNNSYTKGKGSIVDIRIMDNYYFDKKTGKCYFLATAGKENIDMVDGLPVAKNWTEEIPFKNKADFMAKTKNDPSVLNMYDLSEETVTEVSEVVAKTTEAGEKYYTFSVVCDANKAFIPYLPVMQYMLDQQVSGAKIKDKGKVLTFEVEIWENGLFKKYDVTESYGMNIAKIINGKITLNSTVKFNYDNKKQPITKYYDNGFTAKNVAK